jgi:branched-chain amino acid transport system substrate-binding protein
MYIVSLGDLGPKEPFDEEKTGWGWRTIARLDSKDTILPTSCKMNRPS